MSRTASLGRPAWMTAPPTRAVMAALETAGGAGCARFVGGCVRNALMSEPIADIDIATILEPQAVITALATAGLRSVPTGVDHGTVTAISEGRPYEITTLRRDVSTDGRRAVVAFTTEWSEDAQRRDFRFNALYADGAGAVFDPTGHGVEDAQARRVVFVGDAATRIREDYLRILRFFRFLAWYGQGEPDAEALEACAALKGGLGGLAAERIAAELLKLLSAPDPRAALRLMAGAGVLAAVLPFHADLERVEALVDLEAQRGVTRDPGLRLAALLRPEADDMQAAAQRLRLSNALRDRLLATAPDDLVLDAAMSPQAARAALFRLGPEAFADRVILAWAGEKGAGAAEGWRGLLALPGEWTPPDFPLGGDDALAMGARGPGVGQALKAVQAWWVAGDFRASRDEALERLKATVVGEA